MFNPLPILSIFFLLLALICQPGLADDDAIQHSYTGVVIDEATQIATGIKTLELQFTQNNPEIETFAVRVDLSTLINLRKDYFLAKAKQQTAQIKLQRSQKNVLRLQHLQRDKAVSTRKLHEQQTLLKIDQTTFNAAQLQSNNILLYAQVKWGRILSDWYLSSASPSKNMLKTLDHGLYLVSLPPQIQTPSNRIFIQPLGLREKAETASLVSAAPINENNLQQAGATYFYLGDPPVKEHFQRVTAWLPLNAAEATGVIIPASALVWHLGQAYVYLQLDDEQFKRIKITQKKLIHSDAYFIHKELQQGDKLVSIGAQMLLSEEFRSQIPAEDDDDD
ncbi:hypothetical protein [Methyloprofundus sp.]|uniref:hypothetical protein n=1 Tax=Methyloprofundus sp. TaxID=2020875 RepID=UPI003D12A000